MEKINKTEFKIVSPIKITIEDLSYIEKKIKEYCGNIKIETDSYKFESIEELTKNIGKNEFNNLRIESDDPYISLNFRDYNGLSIGYQDDIKLSFFNDVFNFLKSKKVKIYPWSGLLGGFCSLIIFTGGMFLISYILKPKDILLLVGLVTSIVLFFLNESLFRWSFENRSRIIIKNKDIKIKDILLVIISFIAFLANIFTIINFVLNIVKNK